MANIHDESFAHFLERDRAMDPPRVLNLASHRRGLLLLTLGFFILVSAAPIIAGRSLAGREGALSNIAQVWANEGGDKVWRSELRATHDPASVRNLVWDGSTISLFGARNEVISFNLILEAPQSAATNVRVELTELIGPGGARITTRPASGNGLFDFRGRNIELFYVRYLQIKGLSIDLAYNDYDERHIPERCRRPYDQYGIGTGTWQDRPCHDQFYPEIAVPLELHTPFNIPAGTNQAIWGDIYIPKGAPAGLYTGVITVREGSATTWQIPIHVQVRNFTLPDLPSARTMIYFSEENINDRYLGEPYPDKGTAAYARSQAIINRHFQLAHRHKFSLIDGGANAPSEMAADWLPRLNGSLFTAAQGYDGPGVGVGNNVYSIGTYGSWNWQNQGKQSMWTHTDAWVNWFDAQGLTTPTDYFLYLIDESTDFPQIEQWAKWMNENPGPGGRLPSMATIALPDAINHVPDLDIPTSGAGFGVTSDWENALAALRASGDKRFWMYNGSRPGSGSFATEDEGVALRELAWGGYKKGVERWFYWESTYYINFQCYGYNDPKAITNVFQQAQTFGCYSYDSPTRGQAGWNYFNGDGVLFYPGTDTRYPAESYGLDGPFASLRLKLWRRGIQDVDYLTLAAAIDPARVRRIVQRMVPKVLWEYGVDDPNDPTWVRTDISWSIDPDDWEAARNELADIIDGGVLPTATPTNTPTPGPSPTPTSGPSPTPTPTATATPTPTFTPTPTPAPVWRFRGYVCQGQPTSQAQPGEPCETSSTNPLAGVRLQLFSYDQGQTPVLVSERTTLSDGFYNFYVTAAYVRQYFMLKAENPLGLVAIMAISEDGTVQDANTIVWTLARPEVHLSNFYFLAPTPTPTSTPSSTPTPSATPTSTPTPTPSATPTPTSTPTPTRQWLPLMWITLSS